MEGFSEVASACSSLFARRNLCGTLVPGHWLPLEASSLGFFHVCFPRVPADNTAELHGAAPACIQVQRRDIRSSDQIHTHVHPGVGHFGRDSTSAFRCWNAVPGAGLGACICCELYWLPLCRIHPWLARGSGMGDEGLIAVTGASGYIGKAFTRLAEDQGHQIAKLGRQTFGEDLTLPAQPLKAVIHLAYDWTDLSDAPENRNVRGTRRLFEAIRTHSPNATIVLASSVSARLFGGNVYGRIKAAQEDVCREFEGISARIGLVFGGKPRGQMKTLMQIARCPILVVPGGQILVQPIHVSDVAAILLNLACRGRQWSGTYIVAGEPVRTLDFLGVRCNVDWTPQDCFAFAASISSTFSVGSSRKNEHTPPATRTRRGSRRDFDLLARRSTREHGQTQRRT